MSCFIRFFFDRNIFHERTESFCKFTTLVFALISCTNQFGSHIYPKLFQIKGGATRSFLKWNVCVYHGGIKKMPHYVVVPLLTFSVYNVTFVQHISLVNGAHMLIIVHRKSWAVYSIYRAIRISAIDSSRIFGIMIIWQKYTDFVSFHFKHNSLSLVIRRSYWAFYHLQDHWVNTSSLFLEYYNCEFALVANPIITEHW